MRVFLLLSVIILCLCGLLHAQNFPAFPAGEYWQFPDARTLGLAGAGSVSNTSAGALMLNPAAMANHSPGITLDFSPAARHLDERRSFPLFDRFGDINQFNIYAINGNWFSHLQGGLQYTFGESVRYLKSLAAGVFNEINHNYEYLEEVRQNTFPDDPLAYNTIRYEGKLTRYSFGAALQFMERLNVGLQAGLLSGNLDQSASIVFVDNNDDNTFTSSSRSMDNTPIVTSVGVTYQVNPYFNFGGFLRLPYTLEYKVRDNSSPETRIFQETIGYPMQFTGGLEYRAQQILQARLNVDFSYEWWGRTDFKVDGERQDKGFEDVIGIKAGIEHVFHNRIPFQVGVQYRTYYQNRSETRLMFSAGSGFRGENWFVNLAGGFSKLNYPYRDLFDDSKYGGDRSNSSIDDVEESYFFGVLTLSVSVR
jgi:hypothetical protein